MELGRTWWVDEEEGTSEFPSIENL